MKSKSSTQVLSNMQHGWTLAFISLGAAALLVCMATMILSSSGVETGESPEASSPLAMASIAPKLISRSLPVRQAIDQEGKAKAEATSSSATLTVSWHDGSPASHIPVITYKKIPFPEHYFIFHTDEKGTLRVEDPPPGFIGFYLCHCGEARWLEIDEGLHLSASITIPKGHQIDGMVLDADGRPVPDADVWLSSINVDMGAPVTKTDQSGKFAIDEVWSGVGVAAFAPSFAPSRVHQFRPEQTTKPMILQLGKQGCSVKGQVVDSHGDPVEGALVTIRGKAGDFAYKPSSYREPPIRAETDERGLFRASSIGEGEAEVVVSHPGHPPWKGTLEVDLSRSNGLFISLVEGAIIRGIAKDSDGKPVSGASVTGRWKDLWIVRNNKTDNEGRFEIQCLPVGESFAVIVSKSRVGRISSEMNLEPGEELSWDPILESGAVICGAVFDGRGDPIENCRIQLRPMGSGRNPTGFRGDDTTDSEGRFRITNCPNEPFSLLAYRWQGQVRQTLAELNNVKPSDTEMAIRVEVSELEMKVGKMLLRFIDESGNPAQGELLIFDGPGDVFGTHQSDPKTGEILVVGLSPGRYGVQPKGHPMEIYEKGTCEVKAGETLRLDDKIVHAPGFLNINLDRPVGVDGNAVIRIQAADAHWDVFGMLVIDEQVLEDRVDIGPGLYHVTVEGSNLMRVTKEIRIESGKETTVELALSKK